jgi:signal peptidase I
MDIKDIKKAGIDDAEEIKIKKIKTKGKNIDVEEISIKRGEKKCKVCKLLNYLKKFWDKLWFILWKDDSLKGWFFSIIFLFILIKFIFFPALSLVTGTALPLAIVESCSMYHEGVIFYDYDNWWQGHESKYLNYEIEKNNFADFVFKNGFNKGDILFIIGAKPEKLKIGDVIIFNAGQQNPVIHRVISIENQNGSYIFSTIGDNNNGQLSLEKNIKEEQLMGKAIFKIAPYIGWGKLIFFEGARDSSQRGFCKEN